MIVNIFSPLGMTFIISVVGRADLRRSHRLRHPAIKEMYDVNDDGTVTGRKAIMGALTLYLDFINLFLFLLQLIGDRR